MECKGRPKWRDAPLTKKAPYKPDAPNAPVRFDEGGVETGTMARLLRHRQTKEAETDRPGLTSTAPHSYSTVKTIACGNAGRFRCTRCYSCAFYQYQVHARPRVQWAPGIPRALIGAENKCTTRAHRVAGREPVFGIGGHARDATMQPIFLLRFRSRAGSAPCRPQQPTAFNNPRAIYRTLRECYGAPSGPAEPWPGLRSSTKLV
jgi:hypothetical protein